MLNESRIMSTLSGSMSQQEAKLNFVCSGLLLEGEAKSPPSKPLLLFPESSQKTMEKIMKTKCLLPGFLSEKI